MSSGDVDQDAKKLEEQLRNMILSNVRISDDKPPRTARRYIPPHQQSSRYPRQQNSGADSAEHTNLRLANNGASLANPTSRSRQQHVPYQTTPSRSGPNQANWVPSRSPNAVYSNQGLNDGRQQRTSKPPHNRVTNIHPGQTAQVQSQSDYNIPRAGSGLHSPFNRALDAPPPTILKRQEPIHRVHPPSDIQTGGRTYGSLPPEPRHTYRQAPRPPPLEVFSNQCQFLDHTAAIEIPKVEISLDELTEKESFVQRLEAICQDAYRSVYPDSHQVLSLKCFGSLRSGFATRGSDVDLAIVLSPSQAGSHSQAPIEPALPRLLEKSLLDMGLGARLLTRTRVPILKVCEKPTAELYNALCEERQKWDDLPEEEKYPVAATISQEPETDNQQKLVDVEANGSQGIGEKALDVVPQSEDATQPQVVEQKPGQTEQQNAAKPHTPSKPWLREKKLGPLDFPASGVGIQCDINSSNPLALHNTKLLRCYSLCDPRVRPMVLFVKAWAKRRKINSARNGTLSSYGYVLMVLHFLANIAQPPVVPNLQRAWQPPQQGSWTLTLQQENTVDGWDVRFWKDEEEIKHLAAYGRLTHNHEPLGVLLRNFFHYYAAQGPHVIKYGFNWTQEVLSLRTPGGIRTKGSKGWTGARTTTMDNKEVRHRYLFAIEDPFELDHNVGRTVMHFGVVAIRDEFRRAWRILEAIGRGDVPEGELFADVVEQTPVSDGVATAAAKSDGGTQEEALDVQDSGEGSKALDERDAEDHASHVASSRLVDV